MSSGLSGAKWRRYTGAEISAKRKLTGLNQAEFWRAFGVSQPGGCRYESGREIPEPVQRLLNLVFGSDARSQALLEKLRAIADKPKRKRVVIHAAFGMLP